MSKDTDISPVRQGHLPHNGEELPGAPPPDARTPEEAQSNAEALIHSLILQQKRETSPNLLPKLIPQEEIQVTTLEPAPAARRGAEDFVTLERNVADLVIDSDAATTTAPKPAGRKLRLPRVKKPHLSLPRLARRRAKAPKPEEGAAPSKAARRMPRVSLPRFVRNYRPTPRHLALVVLALIVVTRPLLLPIVAVVTFWVGLIVYLTLGPERCVEIGTGLWLRFVARYPERAERVRLRADAFAERFDRLLDRLPERWADRLALPDFSGVKVDDADRPDPFDRLASQARDA